MISTKAYARTDEKLGKEGEKTSDYVNRRIIRCTAFAKTPRDTDPRLNYRLRAYLTYTLTCAGAVSLGWGYAQRVQSV